MFLVCISVTIQNYYCYYKHWTKTKTNKINFSNNNNYDCWIWIWLIFIFDDDNDDDFQSKIHPHTLNQTKIFNIGFLKIHFFCFWFVCFNQLTKKFSKKILEQNGNDSSNNSKRKTKIAMMTKWKEIHKRIFLWKKHHHQYNCILMTQTKHKTIKHYIHLSISFTMRK